jgi:hypothetical protein
MDHDVIAFGNDDAGSVVEFGREMRSELFQACAAGWDDGVVLDVVGGEDFIEEREVTIIEDASEALRARALFAARVEAFCGSIDSCGARCVDGMSR